LRKLIVKEISRKLNLKLPVTCWEWVWVGWETFYSHLINILKVADLNGKIKLIPKHLQTLSIRPEAMDFLTFLALVMWFDYIPIMFYYLPNYVYCTVNEISMGCLYCSLD
jgi:hypothetical protein